MGQALFHGKGVSNNCNEAFKWFKKSSDNGYDRARFYLSQAHHLGDHGVPLDPEESFRLCKLAAEGGYLLAIENLTAYYDQGQGVAACKEKAFSWAKKGSMMGSKNSQCSLGHFYLHGCGTAINKDLAREWFQKSADQGHVPSVIHLGEIYASDGNLAEAFRYYLMAAHKDHPPSQYQVAHYYLVGIEGHVQANKTLGKKWAKKAADNGHAIAQALMVALQLFE